MVARKIIHSTWKICTEYHDLKSQELMKNYQICSKWCSASAAVSINQQSHMWQCRSLSRTTHILGPFLLGFASRIRSLAFGIRKLLEISPAPLWLCQPRLQRAQELFQAGTKSGTNGFESLRSVIKNQLKISWSVLLSLQKDTLITNLWSVH